MLTVTPFLKSTGATSPLASAAKAFRRLSWNVTDLSPGSALNLSRCGRSKPTGGAYRQPGSSIGGSQPLQPSRSRGTKTRNPRCSAHAGSDPQRTRRASLKSNRTQYFEVQEYPFQVAYSSSVRKGLILALCAIGPSVAVPGVRRKPTTDDHRRFFLKGSAFELPPSPYTRRARSYSSQPAGAGPSGSSVLGESTGATPSAMQGNAAGRRGSPHLRS